MKIKGKIYRQLIKAVSRHPILWEKREKHSSTETKKLRDKLCRETWQAIAEELKTKVARIRDAWYNIRAKYKRNLKCELKNGITPTWLFYADMEFVRNVVLDSLQKRDGSLADYKRKKIENEALNKPPEFPENQGSIAMPSTSQSSVIPPANVRVTEFQPIILSKQWQSQEENTKENFSIIKPEANQIPEISDSSSGNMDAGENRQTFKSVNLADFSQSPRVVDTTSNSDTSWREYTVAFKCMEIDASNLQSRQMHTLPGDSVTVKNEPLTEDVIDLTDPFQIKPIQVEATPTPPHIQSSASSALLKSQFQSQSSPSPALLTSQSFKAEEQFQESHVSTSKRAIEESAEDRRSALSLPKKKRSKMMVNNLQVESKDEDYYFAMSLLPSLRKIANKKKIALRIGIMNLIAKNLD